MLRKFFSALLLLGFSVCSVAETSADVSYQVELELAKFDSGTYRRPYVAVWVATEKNQPIKVIRLLREHERWLKDLKYFWRRVLRIDPPGG